jgi:hypothetical protein
VGVLVVKIFALCFGYLRSQFVRVLEVKICENQNTKQRFLLPALSQIENRGNKNTKQRFLPPALLFSICESAGDKNLCFVFCYLCSQFVRVLEVKIFAWCFGYLRFQFFTSSTLTN